MILNGIKVLPTTLQLLEDSPFVFHLGGSRRMAEIGAKMLLSDETDYDFYATYTEEVEKWLIANGFYGGKAGGESEYQGDDEIVAIYVKDDCDVVLRKDAIFYQRVFESIPFNFFAECLWKRHNKDSASITKTFNALYEFARNIQGVK